MSQSEPEALSEAEENINTAQERIKILLQAEKKKWSSMEENLFNVKEMSATKKKDISSLPDVMAKCTLVWLKCLTLGEMFEKQTMILHSASNIRDWGSLNSNQKCLQSLSCVYNKWSIFTIKSILVRLHLYNCKTTFWDYLKAFNWGVQIHISAISLHCSTFYIVEIIPDFMIIVHSKLVKFKIFNGKTNIKKD